MAIKFVSIKCPECGSALNIEEGRQQCFCSYCGTKIMIQNDNEYIYRHIDEAGVKQAETDQMIRMRQMAMAEKQQTEDRKILRLKIIISLILAIVGSILLVVGSLAGEASGNPDSDLYMLSFVGMFALLGIAYIWLFSGLNEDRECYDGKVRVPSGVDGFEKKNYAAVEAAFKSAGFTNIKCVPLNDLTVGLIKKPGTVESITINGKSVFAGGKKYYPDAAVLISYHSL